MCVLRVMLRTCAVRRKRLCSRVTGCRSGGAGAAHARQHKVLIEEHVERLLQTRVLQEKPGRIPVEAASVRVAGLVQRVSKYFSA